MHSQNNSYGNRPSGLTWLDTNQKRTKAPDISIFLNGLYGEAVSAFSRQLQVK